MQLAERILRELTTAPLLTRQLAAKLDARTSGVMVACRCLRHKGLIHTENGLHALTRAGKNLLADGGFIPCQRKGRNATSAGRTLRQRAWSVMRMADHFTVDSLMQTVCDGDEGNAGENLRNYCRALFRAGILGRTARTRAYFLRSEANTGPWPRPTTGRKSASPTAIRARPIRWGPPMREEARHLLHEAIAAHGVAATARRLGVARASLSLLYHDKYPGSTARMEERILRVLASPCPVYGGPWGQDICAGRRATPMPTSNPYALRQWRECRNCPNFTEETTC